MTLLPTTVAVPTRYHGPSSSADFNTMSRSIYQDITQMYAAVASQSSNTALSNEVLGLENANLATQVASISEAVGALSGSYSSLLQINSTGTATMGASFYGLPISYGGMPSYPVVSVPASYSSLFGQILPNMSSAPVSKLYTIDVLSNQVVAPPGVGSVGSPVVSPSISPFMVDSNSADLAVDGLGSTYWRSNVYFPASTPVSSVSITYTATLPTQFINSPNCNYVVIDPYPAFGASISSVLLSGTTELLAAPLASSGPVRLIFPEMAVTSVTVTLTSSVPLYTLKPGFAAFALGARTIDIGRIDFNQSPSKILVPFVLGNNYFSTVTAVSGLPSGATAALYYQTPAGDLTSLALGSAPLGYASTVFVELTLNPSLGAIPVVDDLSLTFVPFYTA